MWTLPVGCAAQAENKTIPGQALGPGQRGLEAGCYLLQVGAAAALVLTELLSPSNVP